MGMIGGLSPSNHVPQLSTVVPLGALMPMPEHRASERTIQVEGSGIKASRPLFLPLGALCPAHGVGAPSSIHPIGRTASASVA